MRACKYVDCRGAWRSATSTVLARKSLAHTFTLTHARCAEVEARKGTARQGNNTQSSQGDGGGTGKGRLQHGFTWEGGHTEHKGNTKAQSREGSGKREWLYTVGSSTGAGGQDGRAQYSGPSSETGSSQSGAVGKGQGFAEDGCGSSAAAAG